MYFIIVVIAQEVARLARKKTENLAHLEIMFSSECYELPASLVLVCTIISISFEI